MRIPREGSEREVDAIVYDSFDEANELVAMLATDDKKPLTEAEVSRGVQQMLVLGVDTERAARASRAPRGKVTAMRMMAGRAPEGVQVTLDQALAASELPDEDAEAVLAAGDSWRWEVSKIKSRIAEEKKAEKRLEALAKAGVEVVSEKPEGLVALRTVHPYSATPAALGKEARELGPECVAMVDPDGTVRLFGPEGAGAKALTQEEMDRERSMSDSSDLYDASPHGCSRVRWTSATGWSSRSRPGADSTCGAGGPNRTGRTSRSSSSPKSASAG